MKSLLLVCLAAAVMTAGCASSPAPQDLADGDIVMIRSHSYNANAIEAVTGSRFTHCGIIFKEGGRWRVYEGAGRKGHLPLEAWIKYESAKHEPHWKIYRLKDDAKLRQGSAVAALKHAAAKLHNTWYDHGFSWDYPKGDEERVYCSELIWKAYKEALGIELCPLRKMSSYPMNGEALAILNSEFCKESRGGQDYSPEELAVAPGDIVAGGLVVEVKRP
ncbi:MAG TPA: YiiX/YebB-like N1pC/P60 family cysteine hydrolase [Prosthecobacter sp.]|nr:YiiX/YebB-like N1pC/P60 family cysteine hydrolase [Prosthecobacter sp.]